MPPTAAFLDAPRHSVVRRIFDNQAPRREDPVMTGVWALAALWPGLALLASLLSIRLRICPRCPRSWSASSPSG